jgi:tetratricopeptide (TPR) repeat protein
VTITYGIMNKNPDRPQQINWSLWQVIEKALDKSPQLRYRSAKEYIEAIEAAMRASQSVVLDPKANQPPPYQQAPQQQLYNQSAYGQQQGYGQAPPPIYGVPPQQPQYPTQNPYGNQQPMQVPYIPGMGTPMQGPSGPQSPYGMQVPIYYPPPPRKPFVVMSAQTKRFMAELFVYVVALATVAWMIVNLFNYFTGVMDRNSAPTHTTPATTQAAAKPPADEADQWNTKGANAQQLGDYKEAERDFIQAISTNPNNPEAYAFLGELYTTEASQKGESTPEVASDKRELLRLAAVNYESSASRERDPSSAKEAHDNAAQAWLERAQIFYDEGRVREARNDLDSALKDAEENPSLHKQIQDLLLQWSGAA